MSVSCQRRTHAPQQTVCPIGDPSTAREQAYGNFNWLACALEFQDYRRFSAIFEYPVVAIKARNF
jgi:hypothetical protein